MFFSLRLLKRLNLDSSKHLYIHKRSLNISKYYFVKKRIYVSRGLYPVKYFGGKGLNRCNLKFGEYSFTRKPFAIPEKKYGKRR